MQDRQNHRRTTASLHCDNFSFVISVKKRGSVKHLASGLRVYDENHDAEIDCPKTDVMLVRNRLIAVDSLAWMCDNKHM